MKFSKYPCPVCQTPMVVIGINAKKQKLTSCGHFFSFKKTRSQKVIDRKYRTTDYGLEKVK